MPKTEKFKFDPEPVWEWWTDLTGGGQPGEKPDTGGWAELRRCRTVLEVQWCPAYHRLHGRLQPWPSYLRNTLAVIAGVLPHVKQEPPAVEGEKTPSLGLLMARPKKTGGQARVSGLRFRRLIQVDDRAELYSRLVGILRQLDHTADVRSLAEDIFYWGSGRKQTWAYDYYAAAPDSSDPKAA